MTHTRRIVAFLVVLMTCVVGWYAYSFYSTWKRIPEAYAAWDTGTLLVKYIERHQDRWPTSWDGLLAVLEPDNGRVQLRGGEAGDLQYARSLREKVVINWNFDPAHPDAAVAVIPPGGGDFAVVWEGAEPNEMVRSYLMRRASPRALQDAD
jgi:hypothetical protein